MYIYVTKNCFKISFFVICCLCNLYAHSIYLFAQGHIKMSWIKKDHSGRRLRSLVLSDKTGMCLALSISSLALFKTTVHFVTSV